MCQNNWHYSRAIDAHDRRSDQHLLPAPDILMPSLGKAICQLGRHETLRGIEFFDPVDHFVRDPIHKAVFIPFD
jgi:hypothetical protein